MKRAIAWALAISTALVYSPAGAGETRERDFTLEYSIANGVLLSEGEDGVFLGTRLLEIPVKKKDRQLSVTVTDSTGLPTLARLAVDKDGDDIAETVLDFCGQTEAPVAVKAAKKVTVRVGAGRCPDGLPAIFTQGTITATLTR